MTNINTTNTEIDFSKISISNKGIPNFNGTIETIRSCLQITYEIIDPRLEQFDFNPTSSATAGIDLRACVNAVTVIHPGDSLLIGSGMKFQCPMDNTEGLLLPQSGLGHKEDIILGIDTGVIDADYTEEVKINVWNRSNKEIFVRPMDLIAQLVFIPRLPVQLVKGKVTKD